MSLFLLRIKSFVLRGKIFVNLGNGMYIYKYHKGRKEKVLYTDFFQDPLNVLKNGKSTR